MGLGLFLQVQVLVEEAGRGAFHCMCKQPSNLSGLHSAQQSVHSVLFSGGEGDGDEGMGKHCEGAHQT